MLKEGDKAPDFTAKDQDGREVKLSDFSGKRVVLYFYPKDDTPGCTKEACSFRDADDVFNAKGIKVLGVSTDDEKSHQKFISKFQLPFDLLAAVNGLTARKQALAERIGPRLPMTLGPLTYPAQVGRRYVTLGRRRSPLFIDSTEQNVRRYCWGLTARAFVKWWRSIAAVPSGPAGRTPSCTASTGSASPAPGGGSVSAYLGSLGAAACNLALLIAGTTRAARTGVPAALSSPLVSALE